jgi:hypothetical protein
MRRFDANTTRHNYWCDLGEIDSLFKGRECPAAIEVFGIWIRERDCRSSRIDPAEGIVKLLSLTHTLVLALPPSTR